MTMPSERTQPSRTPSHDALIEKRVEALEAINNKRNEYLRQMYDIIRKREDYGTMIVAPPVEGEEEEDEDLSSFLERFNIEKDLVTGSIENLTQDDTLPSSLQATTSRSPSREKSATSSRTQSVSPSPPPPPKRLTRSSKPPSDSSKSKSKHTDHEQDRSSPKKRKTAHPKHVGTRVSRLAGSRDHDVESDGPDELDLIGSHGSSPIPKSRQSTGPPRTGTPCSPERDSAMSVLDEESDEAHEEVEGLVEHQGEHSDEPVNQDVPIQSRDTPEIDVVSMEDESPAPLPNAQATQPLEISTSDADEMSLSMDEPMDLDDDDIESVVYPRHVEEATPVPAPIVPPIGQDEVLSTSADASPPPAAVPQVEVAEDEVLPKAEEMSDDEERELQLPLEELDEAVSESMPTFTKPEEVEAADAGKMAADIAQSTTSTPTPPAEEQVMQPVSREKRPGPEESLAEPEKALEDSQLKEAVEQIAAIEADVEVEQPEETSAPPAETQLSSEASPSQKSEASSPTLKSADDGPTSQSIEPLSVQVAQGDQETILLDLVPEAADEPNSGSPETKQSDPIVDSQAMEVDEAPLAETSPSEDREQARESTADIQDSVTLDVAHSAAVELPTLSPSRELSQAQSIQVEAPVEAASSSGPILSGDDSITRSQPGEPATELKPAATISTSQPLCVRPQDTILPIRPPILAPAPAGPIAQSNEFAFQPQSCEMPLEPSTQTSFGQLETIHQREYPLPPLKYLPSEYQRRGRTRGQRKKQERGSEKDWAPLGLNRWGIMMHINPVYDKVSKAHKCLSTRDWSVALTELTLLRTLDRIENLKTNKQWSFRQPKKQRAVGGLVKTHWDYLIDEVKWMRTDFREERRWKLALAHKLAHEAVQWHTAGTHAERLAQGISVSWKRKPLTPEDDMPDAGQTQGDAMEVEYPNNQPKSSLLSIDYGSDEEDDDEQDFDRELQEQGASILEEAGRMIQDSVQPSQEQGDDSAEPNPLLVLKREEVEDAAAIRLPDEPQSNPVPQISGGAAPKQTSPHEALKNAASDPVLGNNPSHPISGDQSPAPSKAKKATLYPELRDRIAYSDDLHLFLTPEDLIIESMNNDLVISDVSSKANPPELASIFSDLQPYDFIDVAPAQLPPNEKKKSASRAERDDPHKRAEDTTYSKLAPVSKYMHTKPVLLGPLQPARRWKGGAWVNMEDSLPVNEADIPLLKFSPEARCNLFDLSDDRPPRQCLPISMTREFREPESTKEQRRKAFDDSWSAKDDELLKSLVDKYRTNWSLIAECFNSMRTSVPKSEKRTKWECYNRWFVKWGRDEAEQHATALNPSSSIPSQVSTRGVKRQSTTATPGVGAGSGVLEVKKRRRHLVVQDAVRRHAKKRENAQKASGMRKSATVHDTHAQYTKMPKLSPIELTRVKAEKDSRDNQEQALRRRNEELSRQQAMPHASARPPGATPPQAQPQLPNVARSIPPSQGVPQIRGQVNISQQQRIPTPLSGAAGRIASPLSTAQQAQQAQRALQALAAQSQTQGQAAPAQGVPQNQFQVFAQLQHQPAMNGTSPVPNPHMSPPFASRDITASPAQSSPPRPSTALANALTSPRPTSAQANIGHAAQVPSNALPRTANLGMGPQPNQTHLSPEQIQRIHVQTVLQQAQQAQQAQNQALAMSQGSQNGNFAS